ncbi:MAG: endonuclease domain-containing protein [Tepidiformaceae bacterium]
MRAVPYVHNIPAARRLRRPQTATEAALWEGLRDRRFLGLKFRRQHAIHNFVLDFYCPELQLAIEVDGPVHDDQEQRTRDHDRQQSMEARGIRFIRIPTASITANIDDVISQLATSISPLRSSAREDACVATSPSPDSCVAGEAESLPRG